MHRIDVRVLDARLHDAPPRYATNGAAGLDLRACIDAPLALGPGQSALVPSGIAIHLSDPGLAALVLLRSRRESLHTRKLRSFDEPPFR